MIDFNEVIGWLFASSMPTPKKSGAGTQRRIARERAMAAWRDSYYGDLPEPRYTRQQARADKRAIWKQMRSQRKAMAMKHKDRGGAAAVR